MQKQCSNSFIKKVKILQFPIANSRGGITRYALENWKWMDKSKFQCDFVTMSKYLDFEDEIRKTGSNIYYISCYAEGNKEQFVREFDEILSKGYDVVHLHTKQWKSFLAEEICKKHHIAKVIIHAHNAGIDTSDPIKRRKEEQLHEQVKKEIDKNIATDFWACSVLAADFLFGKNIPDNKIKIMPDAIDIEKFSFSQKIRSEYRKEYGLENCFVIGHVGRFVAVKNHEFLIRLFHEILKEVENVRLVLLGGGELFSKIQRQAKEFKVDNKVLFLGKRNDSNNWYQAMDIFCMPSVFEGLGMAMIEAQAAGLPCIGSLNIPKEVEICDDVVRLPLDINKWVQKVLQYINRPRRDNRKQLMEAGYDIQKQIKEIERIYKE